MRRGRVWLLASLVSLAACGDGEPVQQGIDTLGSTSGPVSTVPSGSNSSVGTVAETSGGQADGYVTCWSAAPETGPAAATFVDATADYGLVEPLTGMHAHAAAFGDANGDGVVDLFVGTFANRSADKYAVRGAAGPSPDRVLTGSDAGFAGIDIPDAFGRTSGAVFADLDDDGDEDLVVSRNFKDVERGDLATILYENTGDGFVVADAGLPIDFGGRSVAAAHFDDDGLLDLFIVEDRFVHGSSKLFRNTGGLTFTDATAAAGIPADVHGLGLAVADVNNDGWADIFVGGSNRLFLSSGAGSFTESGDDFGWEPLGPEDDVAGAAFGDFDRDGWLDLVVGHHFNSTVSRDEEVSVRLYRNEQGSFVDVTAEAGLVPLPTKAPHVEFVDLDNDGWLDILTSASAADGTEPAVFMSHGDGMSFEAPTGLGSDQYWVTAPTADIDRDGRMDVLLVEWEPTLPSLLMMNQTDSGHWLEVKAPIGTRVEVYESGGAGDELRLIGVADVVSAQGYTAGKESVVHFGLGDAELADIKLTLTVGEASETIPGVSADQRIAVWGDC